jgi:hypothetical protein
MEHSAGRTKKEIEQEIAKERAEDLEEGTYGRICCYSGTDW